MLIVDDHAGFRRLARELLELDGFEVIGEAGDAVSGIGAVAALDPDVLLLDVHLPDRDGCDVAAELLRRPDAPAVVLVSSRPASSFGRRLAQSGARGFLSKDELTGAALAALLGRRAV